MASANIDEEPVKTAPAVLATAMRKFAPSAKTIDFSESAPADMAYALNRSFTRSLHVFDVGE